MRDGRCAKATLCKLGRTLATGPGSEVRDARRVPARPRRPPGVSGHPTLLLFDGVPPTASRAFNRINDLMWVRRPQVGVEGFPWSAAGRVPSPPSPPSWDPGAAVSGWPRGGPVSPAAGPVHPAPAIPTPLGSSAFFKNSFSSHVGAIGPGGAPLSGRLTRIHPQPGQNTARERDTAGATITQQARTPLGRGTPHAVSVAERV